MDGAKSRSRKKTPRAPKPKTPPVRGKSAGQAASSPGDTVVKPEDRHQMIALAAYYRAEQRGFMNGDPLQDWLEAEAEVTIRLREVEGEQPAS